jgi:hypothetical protein
MPNGYNWGFGFVLPDPVHRFPAVRRVQPKIPVGFAGRFTGVVLASLCFGLEKITRFHCSTKQKRHHSRAPLRDRNADGLYLFPHEKRRPPIGSGRSLPKGKTPAIPAGESKRIEIREIRNVEQAR